MRAMERVREREREREREIESARAREKERERERERESESVRVQERESSPLLASYPCHAVTLVTMPPLWRSCGDVMNDADD